MYIIHTGRTVPRVTANTDRNRVAVAVGNIHLMLDTDEAYDLANRIVDAAERVDAAALATA